VIPPVVLASNGRYLLGIGAEHSELRRAAKAPRPLRFEERVALLALLNYADFDGRDALLAQSMLRGLSGSADAAARPWT
jgi:hypothetical protein